LSDIISDKRRQRIGKQMAVHCKTKWKASEFASLHWDSKLAPSVANKHECDEQLTVVVVNSRDLTILGV